MSVKRQRIRDPLHNIVEFDERDSFEGTLWRVIQTQPFQRLRRIKQLGFSELVYPGATHTRFAHSIGVFATARQLMKIIKRHIGLDKDAVFDDHQAKVALAAALVHDVGHGMFSHAFEAVGKNLNLRMARHEAVSEQLIKDSEISKAFRELGGGFAGDVAEMIGRKGPATLYGAVVSSQFDADRLDYMRRDRLMCGVANDGIDFAWLIDNLEVGTLPLVVDDESAGEIETFVLGPKAKYAAETFVVALFQLYPTIYFHKGTRAAETVFAALMMHLIPLAQSNPAKAGLSDYHPIVRFARNSDSLANALMLDDTVFWGALSMMAEADDPVVRELADRLRHRRLPKCIDIRVKLIAGIGGPPPTLPVERKAMTKRIDKMVASVEERLQAWTKDKSVAAPRILLDRAERDPYTEIQESKGPLNQIHIRDEGSQIHDIAKKSLVIMALEKFELFRAYVDKDDSDARHEVEDAVTNALKENSYA